MSDQTSKLLNIASNAVNLIPGIVDGIDQLMELNAEYVSIGSPFTDAMFQNSGDLKYVDAYTIGALLSNVAVALQATVTDAGNGNFNKNILNKARR